MTKHLLPLLLIISVHLGCSKDPAEEISQSELVSAVNLEVKDLKSIKALAEKGDAAAQLELGDRYWHGLGVDRNSTESFNWFMKAALQGNSGSQFNVGALLFKGDIESVGKDEVTGLAWVKIAISNGFPKAGMNQLKGIKPGQLTKAVALSKEMIKNNPKLIQEEE